MRSNIGKFLGMFLTILMPITAGLVVYDIASRHEYTSFWGRSPGALMLYGEPPDAQYLNAYRKAATTARARGFKFADPAIVQTNDLFNLWYVRWSQSLIIAVNLSDGMMLMLDKVWMGMFTDDEVECVMAHELGHVIDIQSGRIGHPMFDRTWCYTQQAFADSMGRYLCGAQRYDALFRKHIKNRPLILEGCPVFRPDPDIP